MQRTPRWRDCLSMKPRLSFRKSTQKNTQVWLRLVRVSWQSRRLVIDTVDQKSTLRSASSTPLDDQVELVPSTEDSVELLMKSLMHHTEESSYSTSTSSVTTSSSSQLISTTSTDSANEGFLFGPSLTREPMIDLSNTSPYDKGSHLPAKSTITEQFSSDIEPLPLPSHACSSLHEILAKDYPWLSSELDDDSENKLPSSELRRTPIRYDASQSSICAVSR